MTDRSRRRTPMPAPPPSAPATTPRSTADRASSCRRSSPSWARADSASSRSARATWRVRLRRPAGRRPGRRSSGDRAGATQPGHERPGRDRRPRDAGCRPDLGGHRPTGDPAADAADRGRTSRVADEPRRTVRAIAVAGCGVFQPRRDRRAARVRQGDRLGGSRPAGRPQRVVTRRSTASSAPALVEAGEAVEYGQELAGIELVALRCRPAAGPERLMFSGS